MSYLNKTLPQVPFSDVVNLRVWNSKRGYGTILKTKPNGLVTVIFDDGTEYSDDHPLMSTFIVKK